ncbi:MAG TPA: response regulator [Nitrospirota bacterium]|nr:response regulator [Nitrospirota bacterium]
MNMTEFSNPDLVVVSPPRRAERASEGWKRPASWNGKWVLLMDDDQMVRHVAAIILESGGYRVLATADGREAVAEYRCMLGEGGAFDAVLLDLSVPGGMGGRDTLRQLLAIDPLVKAVVVSGSTYDPAFERFADFGFCAALAKPYSGEDLLRIVGSAITAPRPKGHELPLERLEQGGNTMSDNTGP